MNFNNYTIKIRYNDAIFAFDRWEAVLFNDKGVEITGGGGESVTDALEALTSWIEDEQVGYHEDEADRTYDGQPPPELRADESEE